MFVSSKIILKFEHKGNLIKYMLAHSFDTKIAISDQKLRKIKLLKIYQ